MKNTTKTIMSLVLIVGLGSCGFNRAWMVNHNQNSTQVHLGKNNFKVVGHAAGTSEVSYVLVFGGANKKQLYESAYKDMLQRANLAGSRTLTNIVTEDHVGGIPPFYYKRTVTVSASIVEFID